MPLLPRFLLDFHGGRINISGQYDYCTGSNNLRESCRAKYRPDGCLVLPNLVMRSNRLPGWVLLFYLSLSHESFWLPSRSIQLHADNSAVRWYLQFVPKMAHVAENFWYIYHIWWCHNAPLGPELVKLHRPGERKGAWNRNRLAISWSQTRLVSLKYRLARRWLNSESWWPSPVLIPMDWCFLHGRVYVQQLFHQRWSRRSGPHNRR